MNSNPQKSQAAKAEPAPVKPKNAAQATARGPGLFIRICQKLGVRKMAAHNDV